MKNIVVDFDADSQKNSDSLQMELQFLILDCCDIARALHVYKQLTHEEYVANLILFNQYYHILTDALVVQIVISFSKIFDNHKDAMPLLKTLNRFKQDIAFRKNTKIQNAIDELVEIDNRTKQNFDFKGPRDQCFAHLDKRQVFSSTRIIKCIENVGDLILLVEAIMSKLINLYELCYEKTPIVYEENIVIPDIRNLLDFKERAEKVIINNSVYKNHLELTEDGLKYYPLGIEKK